ncbi:MAG: orotidine-5'-phosphate decarboxylase [Pyrinomonadaceae bacterium]|nr:orotidine-5'-phosphate decarboxylase [Phycisphaerales bacterium]
MPTTTRPAFTHFADRVATLIDATGAPACVGLDPVLDKLPRQTRSNSDTPLDAISKFCFGVLDAVAGIVPIVKPQSACFERFGGAGVALLSEVINAARERGMLVILDAKRGDIGVTAEHYAAAAFDGDAPADAVTLSGYLGPDTLAPMLRPEKGAFVLVRTSNPGSDAVQALQLADGRTVAVMMADMVASLGKERVGVRGLSNVGAVVGATKATEGRLLRQHMPNQYFLVPGYGAQGGTLEDVKELLRPRATSPGELGVIVTASRSVIYAASTDDEQWRNAVKEAAKKLVSELRQLRA